MEDAGLKRTHLAAAVRSASRLADEWDVPAQGRMSADHGFDFTLHMRELCADICGRLPDLTHVRMDRVAVRFCQVRKGVAHGLQASLTPLRFAGGAPTMSRNGRAWAIQRVVGPGGHEMLYLLSFYLPRYLNQSFVEKLATVFHELWHISPHFDGDVRRLAGRCYAHGPNEREFHASMADLADRWLARNPPASLYRFLAYDFGQLRQRHGVVRGTRIATPKLLPKRA